VTWVAEKSAEMAHLVLRRLAVFKLIFERLPAYIDVKFVELSLIFQTFHSKNNLIKN